MREQNYLKRKCNQTVTGEFDSAEVVVTKKFNFSKKKLMAFFASFGLLLFAAAVFVYKNFEQITVSDVNVVQPMSTAMAATSTKRTVLEIPPGTVKANPFLPYKEMKGGVMVNDALARDLAEPPLNVDENSDAVRVMRTVVSGILYDKYSSSAILNIEGSDYLVKKGDVVNNYKVLNITQDSVTVKLGENVYKAGIGELLTDGTIYHNNVSNLNNKFGGENNGVQ